MAYQDKLEDEVRSMIAETEKNVEEKKMFGGLCFMVNDKMCVTVRKERLMFRLDPDQYETFIKKEGCRAMEMRGKLLKDYLIVDVAVLNSKNKLGYWIKRALAYNKIVPVAKGKKKKQTKKK